MKATVLGWIPLEGWRGRAETANPVVGHLHSPRLVWGIHDPVNYKDDLNNIRVIERQLIFLILPQSAGISCVRASLWSLWS